MASSRTRTVEAVLCRLQFLYVAVFAVAAAFALMLLGHVEGGFVLIGGVWALATCYGQNYLITLRHRSNRYVKPATVPIRSIDH